MQKKYFLTNSMRGVSSKSYLLPSFITVRLTLCSVLYRTAAEIVSDVIFLFGYLRAKCSWGV